LIKKILSEQEIKTFIDKKEKERESIKEEIKKYEKMRNDFLITNTDSTVKHTFGSALLQSIKMELKIK
jgi:hypothetical protein